MTTTTLDELRDAVLAWVQNISGREIVLANSGEGAIPREPYVEVFIELFENPTSQASAISEDGLVETVTANVRATITLNIYGDNPMQAASRLARSLFSAGRYLDLWQVCGLGNVENATDLTALQTGALKPRAQMKFNVYSVFSDEFISSFFEHVKIKVDGKESEDILGGDNPRQKAAVCLS